MTLTVLGYRRIFYGLICLMGASLWSCKPEGYINKVKYDGQKYVNTCASFHEDVSKLLQKNQNANTLQISKYDNTDFEYFYLEPGQFEIVNDTLFFRLNKDLDYATYLAKGVAVHVNVMSRPVASLTDMQGTAEEDHGTIVVNEPYLAEHARPFFLYQLPVDGQALAGRQLMLSFGIAQYDKTGQLESYYCETEAQPLGAAEVACCTATPWKNAKLQTEVNQPNLNVTAQSFKFDKLTGTIDVIFDQGSASLEDDSTFDAMLIQQFVDQYGAGDYGLTQLELTGYASPEGRQTNNEELSDERANSLKNALIGLNESREDLIITATGAGEDWERVRLLTHTSSLTEEQQTEVIAIIADSTLTLDQKESKLRRMPYWDTFFEEVFAQARHTEGVMAFAYEGDQMTLTRYVERKPVTSMEMQRAVDEVITVYPHGEAEDPAQARLELDEVLRETATPELYAMQATYFLAEEDYLGAIAALEKAGSFRSDNGKVYQAAIQAYRVVFANGYTLGEQRQLLQEMTAYVERQPEDRPIAFNRAIVLEEIGYLSQSLDVYEQLLDGYEGTAAQLNNRAVTRIKSNQFDAAEADLLEAIDKDANLAAAYFNLAAIYAYKGLTYETIDYLDKAVSLEPAYKALIFESPVFAVLAPDRRFEKYRE